MAAEQGEEDIRIACVLWIYETVPAIVWRKTVMDAGNERIEAVS